MGIECDQLFPGLPSSKVLSLSSLFPSPSCPLRFVSLSPILRAHTQHRSRRSLAALGCLQTQLAAAITEIIGHTLSLSLALCAAKERERGMRRRREDAVLLSNEFCS
jgi:hypothetical protein